MWPTRMVIHSSAVNDSYRLLGTIVQICIAVLLAMYGGALLAGSCESNDVDLISYRRSDTL